MKLITPAPNPVPHLPKQASLIINYVGCDLATPGAIVSLDSPDYPGHWLVCWVTPPCYVLGEWRAGLVPVEVEAC